MYVYPEEGNDLPDTSRQLFKRKKDLIYIDNYKENKAEVSGSFKIVLPQFENRNRFGIIKINEYFVFQMNELKETRKEFYSIVEEESNPSYYIDFKPVFIFSNNEYLSVLCIHDGYTGGNRSWMKPVAYNFNVVTGKSLMLHDVLGIDSRTLKKKIKVILKEYFIRSDIYEDYKNIFVYDLIVKELNEENYFITGGKITVFYNTGRIESLSAGNIFFEIPIALFGTEL